MFAFSKQSTLPTQPSVAIVILNWNGRHFLERFLPSVVASLWGNKRIIVADNASTDDSLAFLQADYPAVELLRNTTNEGFAGGYNTALKQVESDYYVLLNSDVEVTPDWIGPIIGLMEQDATIGACQPKLMSHAEPSVFEYAGACGGWIDILGYPFSRGRVFDTCETDTGQYDNPVPCFWATGAALFVRAKLYHELGGLDAVFFAHQEEIDLCWRMQSAGYKVYAQPASVVYHVGGGTLPKGNSRKVMLNYRNNLIMMAKNLPFPELFWKLWFRLLLDGIAAWKSLLGGDGGYFVAVIRAHLQFIRWVLVQRRQSVYPKKRKSPVTGLYPGSVVWAYFIRKQRQFSKIMGSK